MPIFPLIGPHLPKCIQFMDTKAMGFSHIEQCLFRDRWSAKVGRDIVAFQDDISHRYQKGADNMHIYCFSAI